MIRVEVKVGGRWVTAMKFKLGEKPQAIVVETQDAAEREMEPYRRSGQEVRAVPEEPAALDNCQKVI